MRILLIEDDALIGDGLKVGLEKLGFSVDWFTDGAEGEAAAVCAAGAEDAASGSGSSLPQAANKKAAGGVLVEGILSVARHFGLRVVAEGVETQAQADFLRQRAPDIVYQGYLFGRPKPDVQWLERLTQPA